MKHTASERKSSSSKNRSTSDKRASLAAVPARRSRGRGASPSLTLEHHYAVCVRNDDYPASLELRKLYPVFEDLFAAEHGMVRVIDESGEDYLYPNEFFVRVDLPAAIEKALANIA